MTVDMVQKLHEFMEFYVGAEVTADQWDVEPAVYLIFEYQSQGEEPGLKVAQLPVPTTAWQTFRPVEVLDFLIVPHTEKVGPPPEDDEHTFWGALLSTEAWGVEHRDGSAEHAAQLMRDGENHTIHNRPDRIEMKTISVVSRDGGKFGMTWHRGKDKPEEFIDDIPSDDGKGHLEGAIFDTLTTIVTNLTTSKGGSDD